MLQTPQTPGFREMRAEDVPACRALLEAQLKKYHMTPVFSDAEFAHWFLPQTGVVYSYVVADPATGRITDMASFYSLPSTVISHAVHKTIFAAYLFYYANSVTPLKALIKDLLIIAHKVSGPDRFVCKRRPFAWTLGHALADGVLTNER